MLIKSVPVVVVEVQWKPAYENEICTWLVLTNKQQIEKKKKTFERQIFTFIQAAGYQKVQAHTSHS